MIKCSTPFPGVVNGGRRATGWRAGETEALVLASPRGTRTAVRLLAAFLSRERNESYLLLADAGANLHAMRERGEVSPRDVRAQRAPRSARRRTATPTGCTAT